MKKGTNLFSNSWNILIRNTWYFDMHGIVTALVCVFWHYSKNSCFSTNIKTSINVKQLPGSSEERGAF